MSNLQMGDNLLHLLGCWGGNLPHASGCKILSLESSSSGRDSSCSSDSATEHIIQSLQQSQKHWVDPDKSKSPLVLCFSFLLKVEIIFLLSFLHPYGKHSWDFWGMQHSQQDNAKLFAQAKCGFSLSSFCVFPKNESTWNRKPTCTLVLKIRL